MSRNRSAVVPRGGVRMRRQKGSCFGGAVERDRWGCDGDVAAGLAWRHSGFEACALALMGDGMMLENNGRKAQRSEALAKVRHGRLKIGLGMGEGEG